jgi:tetratricopeptide (TPR) repeat protein
MMEKDPYEAGLEKARAFFTRAEEVASTDNFDYAIDLYLDGLRFAPDALEDGHAPLRRLALIRQGKGGKKPSMVEKVKRLKGKTPLEEMLNAEFLLAKDPDNLAYAESLLKASLAGGYFRTAEWIANLLYEANKASSRPSFAAWILLKESFSKMQMFTRAVAACEQAILLKPTDEALKDELRDLCASMTVEKGKYGKAADFRGSIQDKDEQDKLHSQDYVVKSADIKKEVVERARAKLKQGQVTVTNILELADALFDTETPEAEKEAVSLLENAYQKTSDFTFIKRQNEFKIKKLRNTLRDMTTRLKNNPQDSQLQHNTEQVQHQLDQVEMDYYRLCYENYPTDLRFKYEYGRTLIKAQQYDKAIPLFQESQKDPRLKIASMDKIGLCFLLKGWIEDAIEIFQRALEQMVVKDSTIAKDIRYNLARAYETQGKLEDALGIYRKLAQTDFSYKDVGQRIDKLRKESHN